MKYLSLIIFVFTLTGCKNNKNQNFSIEFVNPPDSSRTKTESKHFYQAPEFGFIGQGVNGATSELKGRVIAYDPDKDRLVTNNNNMGQQLDFYFDRIQDMEDLQKTLEVNVAASFSLGITSVDAKTNYFKQSKYNSYSDYLCAKITVRNPPQFLLERRLTTECISRLRDGQDEFMRFAGDEYINGVLTGGQVILLYQFTSSNQTERESLKASLNATVGTFLSSAKTSTDMKNAMEKLKSHKNTKVYLYRLGDTSPISQDPDALIEYINKFPDLMRDRTRAAILNFISEPIANLEGIPYRNRNFDKIYEQKLYIRKGLNHLLQLQNILNNIDYKTENLSSFPKDNVSSLGLEKEKVKRLFEQEKLCLENCIHDFNKCTGCLLSDDALSALDKHNTINESIVPKVITVSYTTSEDWLPIADTRQKFFVVSISGLWTYGNGGISVQGYKDPQGVNVFAATLQLRDLENNVIRQWAHDGNLIIMDKPNTRLWMRTYIEDVYNGNKRIKMENYPGNPVRINVF